MAGLTPFAEGKALDLGLRGTAYTPAATLYVGLFTTAPDANGAGGVECTGTSYARQTIAFGAYASRQIASSNAPAWFSGSAWGVIPALGIWDAPTGGNLLHVSTISPTPNIANATAFSLASGQVVIQVTKFGLFLAQYILELLFKNTAKSILPTLTAKIFVTAPSDDGAGGTELAASGYAAQTVTYAAYNGTTRRSTLAADAVFTASAPADWGSPTTCVLASGANQLIQVPITPAPTIGPGGSFAYSAANTWIGFAD